MHKLVEKQTYRLTLKITLNLHEITQITDIEISCWYPPGGEGAWLTLCGEGASSALVVQPSSDGVKIKMPYVVDVLLHQPA